jgi:hypothetical protein
MKKIIMDAPLFDESALEFGDVVQEDWP